MCLFFDVVVAKVFAAFGCCNLYSGGGLLISFNIYISFGIADGLHCHNVVIALHVRQINYVRK